jgi:outer membrane receptor protein involved in Fe transport
MGDYYLDAENEHFYSGHTLLNAIASWKINPSWNTRLRLHNLTDRRYAERGDFAFGNYRYFVGEDRAFYLEVQRQF